MIDTLEQLHKHSIKELVDLMNERVLSMKQRETSPSYLRNHIEGEIKSMFGGKVNVYSDYVDSRSVTITHPNMFFRLNFKLTTKSTGEIEKITKLKSSYIKEPGKVKFDGLYYEFNMPCYNYNEKTKKGSIDTGWTTSGESVYLKSKDLDMDMKIRELNSREFCMSIIEKSAASEKNSIEEYVYSSAFQPWIKKMFFNEKIMNKELKPYAKKFDIDMDEDNWQWHAALKAYEENNPSMVQTTIDWIMKDSFETEKE